MARSACRYSALLSRPLTPMQTIELWRWTHIDSLSGKRVTTRYLLKEVDAKARLVEPERVENTKEVRLVPSDSGGPAEWHMTGAFRNRR